MSIIINSAPDHQEEHVGVLDTSEVPTDQRFALWRDFVNLTCGPTQVYRHNDDLFSGSITRARLGQLQTALVRAEPHTAKRTDPLIRRADREAIYLTVVLKGQVRISQDGHEVTALAGDIAAFDNSRPYVLTMPEPSKMFALLIPHASVGLRSLDTRAITSEIWSGSSGISLILARLLEELPSQVTGLSAASADRLGTSISSLVSAMVIELYDRSTNPVFARQAMLLRVQSYARSHLADPALSPSKLADQHHISLRYLQLLFKEHDVSPARWIRNERLARCFEDLQNHRLDHLTVAAIGERWGLYGPSHFSQQFRQQYGMSPREFRHCRLTGGEYQMRAS